MNMPVHPLAGQPLELADTLRSGNAWKIRLACGYMGLALRRRTFDIVQGDLETEAFAAINPWRQVPALLTPEGCGWPNRRRFCGTWGRARAGCPMSGWRRHR